MLFDCHSHSVNSDGVNTVDELCQRAIELALGGITVTDLAKLDQITKRSWEKIFDLENPLTPPEDISLQACLWEVPISAIKKVWFFTAK